MAGSERRRNDPSRSWKATCIGGIAGAIVFWRTYSIESATRITDWIQKIIETAIAFSKATAELLGVSAWLDAAVEWLQSSELIATLGQPFAAGMVVAYAARKLLLTNKLLGYPVIDRMWSCLPDILDPSFERAGLPRYSAFAAGRPFLDRDDEMKHLRRFAGDPDGPFVRFMFIKGKEGVGKTRLSLEWLKILRANGWDVGILAPGTKPLDVRRSRFRRNTAILIDEPGSLPEFWLVLDELLRKKTKIRIILASQVSLRAPTSLDGDARNRIKDAEVPPLHLDGLEYETLATLAPDASVERLSDASGCPLLVLLKPDDIEEVFRRVGLREESARARSVHRVLALASLAGPISRVSLDAVAGQAISTSALEPLFEEADRSTLDAVLPAFRPDIFADQIVLNYALDHPGDLRLLFENAIRLNAGSVEHRLNSLWRRDGLNPDRSQMRETMQNLFDEIVPQRSLDLLIRAATLVDLTALASKNTKGKADLAPFTQALDELAEIVEMRSFDREIRLREAKSAYNAIGGYGKAGDIAGLERWGARLIALAENPAFAGDREIRLREAQGAFNAIGGYSKAGDIAGLERWGARLIALAENPAFAGDREIRLQEAKGADNAIGGYSEVGDIAGLERWGARLIALAENPAFAGDREIRLQEAQGASNAIVGYGKAGDFAGLERWGARLIALAENPAFAGDREIRLQEAQGAFNAIGGYGMAGDIAGLERWGARLIALAENPAFAGDREIRLREAQGAFNAIGGYGMAGDIAGLERWGARLIALAENPAFAGDREIRLQEAKGADNAIGGYGQAGDIAGLERWGARLIALAENPAFAGDREIRLREAKGAFNAIVGYGTAGDFAGLERWGARLIALAENPTFAGDREIRLQEAKGAYSAICDCGTAGDFAGLERWGARLIALAENPAFAGDREIRLQEAQGAYNAIYDCGTAGSDFEPRRQFWWERLAKAARDFPGHLEIQSLANDFSITYAAQAARGWPYGAPQGFNTVTNS